MLSRAPLWIPGPLLAFAAAIGALVVLVIVTLWISGRIGDSLIQVGGLVTKNSAQPLTTIVPLDKIWVAF